MFSGIITAIGRITEIKPRANGMRLNIHSGTLNLKDVKLGHSIAVNGVCLTVTALKSNDFSVDISQETLDCTTGLSIVGEVNLEKALQVTERLHGHLISGHVDGVGEVVQFKPIGDCYQLVIRIPKELTKYIVKKGSVTVDGVSLTVNRVDKLRFSVNLVPHTLQATTLKLLHKGDKVNIEVDMLARYIEGIMLSQRGNHESKA